NEASTWATGIPLPCNAGSTLRKRLIPIVSRSSAKTEFATNHNAVANERMCKIEARLGEEQNLIRTYFRRNSKKSNGSTVESMERCILCRDHGNALANYVISPVNGNGAPKVGHSLGKRMFPGISDRKGADFSQPLWTVGVYWNSLNALALGLL